ncbi:MAG: PDR/VanB family oxidoreductase [Streptosporangiales bacterium]|nr:PDR/VanB family oxidoreductase [Streptosporangiales bacterium]
MATGPMMPPGADPVWPSPDEAPESLFGHPRPDRFLRTLTRTADAYVAAKGRIRVARGHTAPRQPPAGRSHWRKLTVAARTTESDGVVTLRLEVPDGGSLAAWYPGAHVQIELPSGTIRHYSLNGDPADRSAYRISVRRVPGGGGGSAEIHDGIAEGTVLRVASPVNAFPFAAEPAVLFIAGGIGITPILPMARKAASLGLDWRLVYTGRDRASMPFLGEIEALPGAGDSGGPGGSEGASGPASGLRVTVLTDEQTGVPDASALLSPAPAGASVYVCGPPPLLAGVRDAANAAIDAGRLRSFHFERFTAPPIENGRPFEVELSRSGTVLGVPADKSVLDVLRAHDPATPYSCKQGFCGTCVQRTLSGTVDHRDQRLTPDDWAAGDMLVCVSRAPEGERVVLDR